jgi:2,3-bisphosphoglycerate-dependent phosphoglycerate mutase
MTRLIAALIRHADYRQLPETPSAHQPFGLTDKGQQQARRAAAALRESLARHRLSLSASVDSSALLRAWQTAQILSEELQDRFTATPEVTGFAELAERGLGSANNLSMPIIEALIREDPRYEPLPSDWKSDSHFRLPLMGAESLLEAGQRVANHLQGRMAELADQVKTDTLKLFVGHGAAFRHAAYHLKVLELDQIAGLSMYHAEPVYLEYLPGGKWRHFAGEWKIRDRGEAAD